MKARRAVLTSVAQEDITSDLEFVRSVLVRFPSNRRILLAREGRVKFCLWA